MDDSQYAPSIIVRAARVADDQRIAEIAGDNGQPQSQSGADRRYTAHLREHGRLFVAQDQEYVVGFGATVSVGSASMLTDLFVDPRHQGAGVGAAMLGALWPAGDRGRSRFTFASHDPRAISLYARAGLTPLWPLLYLRGTPATLPPATLHAELASVADAARAEELLTGLGRTNDMALLAGGPARGLTIARDTQLVAAGVVAPGQNLAHLACPDFSAAADAVIAGLHALGDGIASLCLPGPHPAVPRLLAAGFRIADFDIPMATEPELLATTWVYSPAMG